MDAKLRPPRIEVGKPALTGTGMVGAKPLRRVEGGAIATEIDDELVLLGLESGELFSLAGTARFVWDRIDGTRNLARLTRECEDAFAGDREAIARDVAAFVGELAAAKLVEAHE
jgi:hypothetical protein